MTTLKEVILSVEDKIKKQNVQWSDWKEVFEILDEYAEGSEIVDDLFTQFQATDILQNAVETNGESLGEDVRRICKDKWSDPSKINDKFYVRFFKE